MQWSRNFIKPTEPFLRVSTRGDGYLRERLGPVYELDSRRLTALRDWLAATLAVVTSQIFAFGVKLSAGWFLVMAVLAAAAIFISAYVYPRLAAPKFFRVELGMMLLAWGTITALVYASGGSASPYIFFYAQTMIFCAYFFGSSPLGIAQIGLGTLCALAPIVYDNAAAIENNFVPTILIALAVWWAMCVVVALKHADTLRAEREARALSLSDALTGSANLRALEEFVASLGERHYIVAMVDLNGLRAVNARHGYFAGDDVLRRTAEALRESSRQIDQVARIGGDEFLVVMPGLGMSGGERWRTRFAERLAMANSEARTGVRLGAAVGVAERTGDASLADVIAVADRELYARKGADGHEPEELIAPHARAQRLAARITAAEERKPSRWDISKYRAPAGIFISLIAAVLTGLVIGTTGGPSSILISMVLVVGAYFAFFGDSRETIIGVGATLVAFAIAVFGNGAVTAAEQTRFLTVVFGTIVIAYALQSNSRKLELAERHAERLSLTDALTGLPNRRDFDQTFGEAVAAANANPEQSAESFAGYPGVVLVDLENFADVNSELGHHGGDELLCEAADALRDAVAEDGTVYRIGGNEFAVIVFAHHIQRVQKVAGRCFEAIRGLDADGHYISQMVAIGAVVGHAVWSPGATSEVLLDSALEMMQPITPQRAPAAAR
jgi:diguanylate cyclase (GGDEF)-like protein